MLVLHSLRSNLRRDPLDLETRQLGMLRGILRHAYKNTEYYRGLFDKCGFNPDHIKSKTDLGKLPILDKVTIKKNRNGILSGNHNKKELLLHDTSGSTGIPLKFYTDRNSRNYNRALTYRAYMENGLKAHDILVQVTSPEYQRLPQFWFQKLGIFRLKRLSVLDEHVELFRQMNSIKPDAIQCYPSVLNLIAKTCDKKKLRFRPKVIFTTAELLLPAWRQNISTFFECDIRDLYGSAEFHRLAWECEKHEGYHLDIDAHVIEFVDHLNNPVDEGDAFVVITGLFNYAFPLIRYRLGDIVTLKKSRCSCGRTLPLIESIQGREDDYLTLPSGKLISPRKVDIQYFVGGVGEYAVTQVRRDLIKVEIVKGEGFNESTIESVRDQILVGCLNEKIDVDVELVQRIKKSSGKMRTVASMIKTIQQ